MPVSNRNESILISQISEKMRRIIEEEDKI
jgi:hypothetical protein